MFVTWWMTHKEFDEMRERVKKNNRVEVFLGQEYLMKDVATTMYAQNGVQVEMELIPLLKVAKTPEQILAAERVTHYRTLMEAAKKDLEYWEGKL